MTYMKIGEAIPSADSFVAIRYTINTGVSFSLFAGHTDALIIVQSVLFAALIVACLLSYFRQWHIMLDTGLSWIVAGGAGNLIDRVKYGYVVDFISVGKFPIWNFADMCVVGGCILLGIYLLGIHPKRESAIPTDKRDVESFDE